ncbi:carbohydrate ABC transporter permease [Neobacillus niacini]|uniref:carbohydrate ABC transporter permease n=1 Tax=Neobacillus niacini TaxID=86668 RepID=UPI002FFE1006
MKSNQMNQKVLHTLFIIMGLASLFPFILLIMASFTDESTLISEGFSILPSQFSFEAYTYLFTASGSIFRAYGISAFVTVVGTATGLLISCMLAYPLSRKDMPYRNVFSFLVFFTLLFNGGLVPTYLVYTELLDIKNTIWSLIVPNLLTNGFFILIFRTFFVMSIPKELIESAYIDGASEFKIFWKIVLPLSLPVIATIGLLSSINYWNDWFNGLIYVTDAELFSIQNLLNRMLTDIQFLQTTNLGSSTADLTSNIPTKTLQFAMAVVGVMPILLAYPFFQKYLVKGLTVGAVKG